MVGDLERGGEAGLHAVGALGEAAGVDVLGSYEAQRRVGGAAPQLEGLSAQRERSRRVHEGHGQAEVGEEAR